MQQSQKENLMETKEEAQMDVSSAVQSWISSKKEWALFSEEEVKQHAQNLINTDIKESYEPIQSNRIEEFYRQPDYFLMLDEAGRTKLIKIIDECLKHWYSWEPYGKEHDRHKRKIVAQLALRIAEAGEQKNDIVDQLFESINDGTSSSCVAGLLSISEMTDTLLELSEAHQQQMVEGIIKIVKEGKTDRVTRIVDVIFRLSVVLPDFFARNGREIRVVLKEYVKKTGANNCKRLVEIAKILGEEVSEEIKTTIIDNFLQNINMLNPRAVELDLQQFLDSDIDGMNWLFDGRVPEKKMKEIISSLMEKIRKEVAGEPCYIKECHAAAMVLPRLSKFLSAEEKQEVADYSVSKFFSLIKSEDFEFSGVAMRMAMALMEYMPEYVSGRELDILKQLLSIVAVVHAAKKSFFHLSEIDLVTTLHRFSGFFSRLAEDEQLQIMDWFMTVFKCIFLYGDPREPDFQDGLAQTIAAVGACIKEMKPELARQWLEKTIDTLLSDDVIKQIEWRNKPVFRLAFVDLMIACLDSMADEQKKYFLNYMHPRFLELMGKGEREKNYFMGMLLMICTDCETKQQTKLYALSGMSKWSPYCGMFADKNLFGLIDRLSDGGLSASSTKHNKNYI